MWRFAVVFCSLTFESSDDGELGDAGPIVKGVTERKNRVRFSLQKDWGKMKEVSHLDEDASKMRQLMPLFYEFCRSTQRTRNPPIRLGGRNAGSLNFKIGALVMSFIRFNFASTLTEIFFFRFRSHWNCFMLFTRYLVTLCSLPEVANDVIYRGCRSRRLCNII